MSTSSPSDSSLRLGFPPSASRKRRLRYSESEEVNPPTPISHLGDDLLAEVLIRLPEPETVWRCQSVCKEWKSLISDPQFVRRFVSHHRSIWNGAAGESEEPPLMTASNCASVPSFLPVPSELAERCQFRVYDCFKDLVLCGFQESNRIDAEFSRSYLLCNPFTKQWLALPLAPEMPPSIGLKVARLVCEPRRCSTRVEFDLGEGRAPFVYSSDQYRFRVVCIYQLSKSVRVDVFCSESGEWTNEARVLDGHFMRADVNVVSTSCNRSLFWLCMDTQVIGFNPFCPDVLFPGFDVSQFDAMGIRKWNISVSQGALHLILVQSIAGSPFLMVWRLEEDRKCLSMQYTTSLSWSSTSKRRDYELGDCNVVALHPEKPHVVFFKHHDFGICWEDAIVSYDVNTGEVGFFAEFVPGWNVFQPRVSCWPTPIPRYEELRGRYDGSYNCWVQHRGS